MGERLKKAGIIVVGSEILKGHVQDINSAFICKRFHAIGVQVCRITTVPDDVSIVAEEVARFSANFDIVVTTGGIGPTHDGITYEAIASAMNDKIVLNSEMADVIRSYFGGNFNITENPALKMARLPQSAKLIFVPPKEEKTWEADRQNGLQKEDKPGEKRSFPIVRVRNVYILPGMTEWLEYAFHHLQKLFEDPDVNVYSMTLFLKVSEFKVLQELNQAVTRYENRVVFGSYPSHSSGTEFKTKIMLESHSLDDVTSAFSYLTSMLPGNFINNDLQKKDVEMVRDLTTGTKSLSNVVGNSLKVIEVALKKYGSKEIYLSFNGGKDCTVLLHLIWVVWSSLGRKERLNSVYIKSDAVFPEVDDFVSKTSERYNMNIVVVCGNIKGALLELHGSNQDIKAIFMGTRRTDPYSEDLNEFQMCDEDWPPLMRVNPILDWSYEDIWNFLRVLAVPYCSLYDEGYTSIGNIKNTKPNPALRVSELGEQYHPAYRLGDASLERQGRN
ncbi:hypothetical protein RUM43_013329 [Polyplax serrata]|uniref:FAD synthase n=1 Tax=Polyplax serrata TaxID=468196 RepID=A0AAN8P1U3_POLSC